MINIGSNEISSIYIGSSEISAIYAGDEQIYPMNLGNVTAITISGLTWVTDVPSSGGTATSANCSFQVYALYDSGKKKNIKSQATITGSLVVPASTADTRELVGTLTLTANYSGFTDSATVDVYQSTDYSKMYLTFEAVTSGNILWKYFGSNTSVARTLKYSKNGGAWTDLTSTNAGATIGVDAGDVIRFKGENSNINSSSSNYNTFSGSTATYNLYGNIMSILGGDNYETATTLTGNYMFFGLFRNHSGVVDASNLILPSTNVPSYGYERMFGDCTTIAKAPELPATSLGNYCYHYMFVACTNLTQAPSVLPATTAPNSAYQEMFQYCARLTNSPDILATTAGSNSYRYMFSGCTSMNYIKCLTTNLGSSTSGSWVTGVASTGTFVKNPDWSSPSYGANAIPSGWVVENAT